MLSLYCRAVLIHLAGTAMNLNRNGSYYLAVLIAYQLTAKSQVGVDYRGQNTVKFVQDAKYSAISADFLGFLLTFAMSLMILLVLICSTKVSEKSDMAKS